MKVRMWNNEIEANLTPFIVKYISNVCLAIVASLKTSATVRSLRYDVSGESVSITLNGIPLPLDLSSGFAEKMILGTVRGMIRLLKMEDPSGVIRIEVNPEASNPNDGRHAQSAEAQTGLNFLRPVNEVKQ
jgi:hypothetical protein